jgi:sigma-B regulation protein RsbU (phosphoserine phosphatase)
MKKLRAIILEDSEDDAMMIVMVVRRSGYDLKYQIVDRADEFREALQKKEWDLVLADYSLPQFNGLAALKTVKELKLDIPFIIVSGQIGEEIAVEAMKSGAHDYVMKDNLTRLVPAIERELKEAEVRRKRQEAERALRTNEARLRQIIDLVPHLIYVKNASGQYMLVNRAVANAVGKNIEQIMRPDSNQHQIVIGNMDSIKNDYHVIETGRSIHIQEEAFVNIRGERCILQTTKIPYYFSEGEEAAVLSVSIDITERKKAEAEIRRMNEELEQRVFDRTAELRMMNRELRDTLRKLQEDEEAGRGIQFQLLPREKSTYHEFQFNRLLLPSMYLSGDFTDYFEINDEHIGLYIADVSGHGISSAFITVLLKGFIQQSLEKYTTDGEETILHPAQVLEKLNQHLYLRKLDKYLTIFYGVINRKSATMEYSNGGHFPFPIFRSKTNASFLNAKGIPVGLFEHSTYQSNQLELPEDFLLLLLSDGILEVLPENSLKEKQKYLLGQVSDAELNIEDLVKKFRLDHDGKYPDDITLLMIKRKKQ